MKRRHFVKIVAVSSLAAGYACNASGSGKSQVNWAWLNGSGYGDDKELKSFLLNLKQHGINGILPGGSNDFYNRIGPFAKELGMEFHAWRWTMNRGGHMEEHPEWYAVNRNGDSVIDKPPYVGYYRWLCPSKPEVLDLLVKDYTALCDIDGMTGVHLDYVRYCDVILPIALQPKYNLVQDHEMPEFDYCYCSTCREEFASEYGYDPLDHDDPPSDENWHRWRLSQLVKIVNHIAGEVHAKGKKISAAVFPTPDISRRLVRQDWERFDLDAFMPMIYFNDYNGDLDWVADVVRKDVKILNGRAPLYAGLNMGHVRDYGVEKVVRTCLDNGADGISFFTGNGMKEDELDAFTGLQ